MSCEMLFGRGAPGRFTEKQLREMTPDELKRELRRQAAQPGPVGREARERGGRGFTDNQLQRITV